MTKITELKIQYLGFDLHDTVLISNRTNKNILSSDRHTLDEYFLRNSKDYFSFWFKKGNFLLFMRSLKKYFLLDGDYKLNPQFIALLKEVSTKKIFIFSNSINIEWIIKLRFKELRNIRFFFAPQLGYFKPNPNAYSVIANLLKVPTKKILFCGDNYYNDYLAPRLVNMNTILYKNNNSNFIPPHYLSDLTNNLLSIV